MPQVGISNEPLKEAALFAWDGSVWRQLKIDADGYLQVEFATAQEIKAIQADASLLKATINVAAGQEIEVTQPTATDLKATVNVATGQEIEVTQPIAADLKATIDIATVVAEPVGQPDWAISAWRLAASNTDLAAGTNILSLTAISTGDYVLLQAVCARFVSTTINEIRLYIRSGTHEQILLDVLSPTNNFFHIVNGAWDLTAGDIVRCVVYNATLGDDLYLYAAGRLIKD